MKGSFPLIHSPSVSGVALMLDMMQSDQLEDLIHYAEQIIYDEISITPDQNFYWRMEIHRGKK